MEISQEQKRINNKMKVKYFCKVMGVMLSQLSKTDKHAKVSVGEVLKR